jgi:hypothetical protein
LNKLYFPKVFIKKSGLKRDHILVELKYCLYLIAVSTTVGLALCIIRLYEVVFGKILLVIEAIIYISYIVVILNILNLSIT